MNRAILLAALVVAFGLAGANVAARAGGSKED
jgi:hypothetical protein